MPEARLAVDPPASDVHHAATLERLDVYRFLQPAALATRGATPHRNVLDLQRRVDSGLREDHHLPLVVRVAVTQHIGCPAVSGARPCECACVFV